MLKRVMNFDKQDWKHVSWLTGNMLKNFFIRCDLSAARESWLWLKLHFTHDSKRIE